MAKKDIILRAGIRFDAKDVDSKAIRDAIVKSITSTSVSISKASFGREGKEALKKSFATIAFQVQKAKFGSTGRDAVKKSFSTIPFVMNNARFGRSAVNQLKKSFAQSQFTVGKARVSRTARENVGGGQGARDAAGRTTANARATRDLSSANRDAVTQFRQQSNALNAVLVGTTAAERATRNYKQILVQGATSAEGFGAKIGQITTRFAAYLISLRALFAVQQAFNASLQVIFQFDSALQDLNKVLNTTPENLEKVAEGLFGVAQTTGQAVTGVADSFGIFIRAGLGVEDALKRAEAALIGANISELSVAESTKFVVSSLRIFNKEINTGIDALDLLSITADNAATTAGEVGRGLLRSGAAAQAVGVTFKELNSVIAATVEATQLSGSQIGSALKTIFARLASSSEALRSQANALGANIKPGEDVFSVLKKLRDIFPSLNKEQKAQISQIVAGKRRFTEFNALITNLGRAEELLVKQTDASGTAFRKNQEELQKLSTRAQIARTAFSELIVSLTSSDEGADALGGIRVVLGQIIDGAATLGNALTLIVDTIKELEVGIFSASAVFRSIVKIGFFALAPKIIKSVLIGFKNFLAASNSIVGSVRNIGTQQELVNSKILQTNRARREGLTIQQRQLQALVEMEAINGRILTQKQRQSSAGRGSAATQGVAQLRRNPRTSGLARAIGAGAVVLALTSVSDGATKLSQAFGTTQDATSRFVSGLGSATSSAAETGILLGLFTKPIVGVIAALGVLSFNLIKTSLGIAASSRIALDGLGQVGNSSLEFAQSVQAAGDFGKQAFIELTGDAKESGQSLVQAGQLLRRAFEIAENDSMNLSRVFEDSGRTFEEVTNRIAGTERSTQVRNEFAKAAQAFRQRALQIQLQVDTGNLGPEFSDFNNTITQAQSKLEAWVPPLASSRDRMQAIQRIAQAVDDAQNDISSTAVEILAKNSLISESVRRIADEEARINGIVDAQKQQLDDSLQSRGRLLAASKERVETLNKEIERLREAKAADESISSLLKERDELEEKVESTNKNIANIKRNIDQSEARLVDLGKQKEDQAKREVKELTKVKQVLDQSAPSADLIAQRVLASTNNVREQVRFLEQQLAVRREIGQQELQAGTIAEQSAVREARLRAESTRQISEQGRLRERQIARLSELEAEAVRNQDRERADSLRNAREALESAADAELEVISRKAELELQIKLADIDVDRQKAAEKALLDFRIANIDNLARKEQELFSTRVALIEKLATSSAGRDVLSDEFRPSQQLQREFGLAGSIIVSELTESTAIAVEAMKAKLVELRESGANEFELLRAAQESTFEATRAIEEENAQKREIVLEKLAAESEKVKNSENKLVTERNKIPALNAKIINSERKLAEAAAAVGDSLRGLIEANQNLADSQFKLSIDVGLAAFKAEQAAGGFNSAGAQIAELRRIFNDASSAIKASGDTILEVRRQILQEELSLLNSQLNTIKGLASQAALATEEEFQNLVRTREAAEQIVSTGTTAGIPEEILRNVDSLTSVIPQLEETLERIGLERLGEDPEIINKLETQTVDLAKSIAETGQVQINQAADQVRAAREQLTEAREAKRLAEQQLNVANQQKAFQQSTVLNTARNVVAVRSGFTESKAVAVRSLEQAKIGARENTRANEALTELKAVQDEAKAGIEASNTKLDTIATILSDGFNGLKVATESLFSGINSGLGSLLGSIIPTSAKGSLSAGEVGGLINAASKEKRLMPPGANLMLANTSEVVLTRKQAKMIGLRGRPQASAQGGNAESTGGGRNAEALSTAIDGLLNKLNDPGFIQQNINVQVDSERKISVAGAGAISDTVKQVFQERSGDFALREEADATADVIQAVIARLSDEGIVDVRGR